MTPWDIENTRVAVIQIIGRRIDPMRAQIFLTRYCSESGIPLEEFSSRHVAKFTLHVAERREDFASIPDGRFNDMLNELVRLSNAGPEAREVEDAPAPT